MIYMAQSEEAILRGCHCCNKELIVFILGEIAIMMWKGLHLR